MKLARCLTLISLIFCSNLTTFTKNITFIGTGYVGLVSGTCFADFGNSVICADIDPEKIEKLSNLEIPIYEPTLDELVKKNVQCKRLFFTGNLDFAIQKSDIIFISVGTPMDETTGKANLTYLKQAAESIAKSLLNYKTIVIKSTVPPGTCEWLEKFLIEECNVDKSLFTIASCPEFLREGSAVYDFLNPDRIIIGSNSYHACKELCEIHAPFQEKNVPIICTSLKSAELIKYVSNSFLALKISFINEIANLCDALNVDVKTISHALGLDKRISPFFLNPGPGFGGSCFPKDVSALIQTSNNHNIDLKTLKAALDVNEKQKEKVFEKLQNHINIEGKTVAILGLTFKANTDDIRYSPSIRLIELLKEHNVFIKAYDPKGIANMQNLFPDIYYGSCVENTVDDADAIIIMTEWNEFKDINWHSIKKLAHKQAIIIDARNILDGNKLQKLGFIYDAIGRKTLRESILRSFRL